jgi:hypothetical protein
VQRKASKQPAWFAVNYIYIFIARTVPSRLECCDRIAKLLLKPILRAEYEPANILMQTVGADHQIKPALTGVSELNLHMVGVCLKADNLFVKDNFRRAFDPFKKQL